MPQPHCRAADIIGMLDYEKLDVYHCAIEHLSFVFKWLPLPARGHSRSHAVRRWNRGAILDVVRLLNAVPDADLVHSKQLVVRMVEMLTRMCR